MFTISSCTLEDDLNPIDSDVRDKFIGTWLLSESPVARSISYQIQIEYDQSNSSRVTISNMGNLGGDKEVFALATTSRIIIESQDVNGIIIEGTGTLNSNSQMTWVYSVRGGGDIENFEAIATKL
jgi:hypothetical protein